MGTTFRVVAVIYKVTSHVGLSAFSAPQRNSLGGTRFPLLPQVGEGAGSFLGRAIAPKQVEKIWHGGSGGQPKLKEGGWDL